MHKNMVFGNIIEHKDNNKISHIVLHVNFKQRYAMVSLKKYLLVSL